MLYCNAMLASLKHIFEILSFLSSNILVNMIYRKGHNCLALRYRTFLSYFHVNKVNLINHSMIVYLTNKAHLETKINITYTDV